MSFRDHWGPAQVALFDTMGVPAIYQFGADAPITTMAILREDVQLYGDLQQVVGSRDELSLLLADVPVPQPSAIVTMDEGTFALEAKLISDGYHERWVVTRE